jgi:hypothetical protein
VARDRWPDENAYDDTDLLLWAIHSVLYAMRATHDPEDAEVVAGCLRHAESYLRTLWHRQEAK